ncbi:hypothetical protein ERJ75_000955800 [Trypanosoma vivax]|nr:hypothetical protein ERJ75_000955800 [Trypanosoma vivax]
MCGVDTVGARLPLLHSLKLKSSRIPQLRLLGKNYLSLKRLWISNSQLQTFSGIGTCAPVLEELYASFNYVSDITPLLDLSMTLEVVDLEGNDIADCAELYNTLPLLTKVKYLTLQGNPVSMREGTFNLCSSPGSGGSTPTSGDDGFARGMTYQSFVQFLMPNLQYLDDIALSACGTGGAACEGSQSCDGQQACGKKGCGGSGMRPTVHVDPLDVSLRKEYMFLQRCIRECGLDGLDSAVAQGMQCVYSRPRTSCPGARPHSSKGINGSRRPLSSAGSQHCFTCSDSNSSANSSNFRQGALGCSTELYSQPQSYSSLLTSGRIHAGGGASLRPGRLPPLEDNGLKPVVTAENVSVTSGEVQRQLEMGAISKGTAQAPAATCHGDGQYKKCGEAFRPFGTPHNPDDIGPNIGLFDDEDDDDDEWDAYRRGIREQVLQTRSSLERWSKYLDLEVAELNSFEHEPAAECSIALMPPNTNFSSTSDGADCNLNRQLSSHIGALAQRLKATTDRPITGISTTPEEEATWQLELIRSVAQTRSKVSEVAREV